MIKLHLNNKKNQIDTKFIEEVIKNDGILILSKNHQDYEEIRNKYPNLYITSSLGFIERKIYQNYFVYIYEMTNFIENIFNNTLKGIRTENSKEFKVVIT